MLTIASRNALSVACRQGLLDIGRLLLTRGACSEEMDIGGATPLFNLWDDPNVDFPRVEFVKAMFASGGFLSYRETGRYFLDPVHAAALNGSGEDVELLTRCGYPILPSGRYENSAMKFCLLGSNVSTFDCIVQSMPDGWIVERDLKGMSALHHAVLHPGKDKAELCAKLLKAGADPHALDEERNTALDIARRTDERAIGIDFWQVGKSRNVKGLVEALSSCGYQVEVATDGEVFWEASE